jgi:uncharacterized repeat protein (TIGR01451 family)
MFLHRIPSVLLLTVLGTMAILPQAQVARAEKAIRNTASYSFQDPDNNTITGTTNKLQQTIIDPLGRLQGCGGETLPDYVGFSVGVYDADANDVSIGLTPLPRTGAGTAFAGVPPNKENVNPFFLDNGEPKGSYNFFLNRTAGQLEVGRRYILIVNPPRGNRQYSQRQIRIVVTSRDDINNTVSYTATALDGKGIGLDGDADSFSTTVEVQDAATTGLVLSALNLLDRPICVGPAQPIQITKTADRASAAPGDTVIYRLSVRNLNTVAAKDITLEDTLPLGFRLVANSARGEFDKLAVPIVVSNTGNQITLKANVEIPPNGVLNVAYAVQLNPDAVRGSGENIASVSARRSDTGAVLRDGPSRAKIRVSPGLLTDCGTIIGRVFDDKNFDGEQQPDEPGIANAVVILDDGTRITTDSNGLYSVMNVLSGARTGVLDLTSVPGYTFAPNQKVKERNSQSRLVRLAPGGLVRMNFGVTPVVKSVASEASHHE